MLTLTRNCGEGLRFGDKGEIEMYVLEVSRGQVKLGFKAPASIRIERKEIYQQHQLKNQDLGLSDQHEPTLHDD